MINSSKVNKILFGGDYNPEQWSEDIWEEDMRLLKLAGVDTVTLNVFNWAGLQSDETTYHFEKLDKIMNLVTLNGLKVCLATSTAAHPAWMAQKYPDILHTDFHGRKHAFGGRHNSCPNSPAYRKYSVLLAAKLAERYKSYDNIVAWHISNEYGSECYCENCEKAFRVWLEAKYITLDELNRVWNTSFWGHTFYTWDEIVLPNLLSEHFLGPQDRTMFQGISLDYRRFNSDGLLEAYKAEYRAVKAITPDIPVTTNFMEFYKILDYQKWAGYLDFISWDSYPSNSHSTAQIALSHDLMRGLKGGRPFALMEQTPSVTNWLPYNALKRPGVMRLWSYLAVAHGSDTIMFFQMRRSIGACEKFHGAVIDHAGHADTRVFREVAALGEELKRLGGRTLGSRTQAKVGILFDWDNWWALEYSAGPSSDLRYHDEVLNYYTGLHDQNIAVDIISVSDDLNKYDVVIAPVLYMCKTGFDDKVREFVKAGGTFITSFFSGIVNEHDLVVTGGYPGKLRDILGIWVEEIDALPPDTANSFALYGRKYPARLLCDIMHLESAEALSSYETDFYRDTPVVTRNVFGRGTAYYVGTRSDGDFYKDFLKHICEEKGIAPVMVTPSDVEAVRRSGEEKSYTFLLNHSNENKTVTMDDSYTDFLTGTLYQNGQKSEMMPKGVMIMEK